MVCLWLFAALEASLGGGQATNRGWGKMPFFFFFNYALKFLNHWQTAEIILLYVMQYTSVSCSLYVHNV